MWITAVRAAVQVQEPSKYLSTSDVQAYFGGVSRQWVYRAVRYRNFPKPLKFAGGKLSFFQRDAIEQWERDAA